MSLPKILLEGIQEVGANEGFTETIYTFARVEKMPDNYGCISVSPNGRKIAIVDPEATVIKIYNVVIDGSITPSDEILLPSNFARKLEAKEVHYSLAISDECTIAISVFNVSPDTLPDVKWSSELSEVDVSDDNKLCLHYLAVGTTRIVVTREGKSLDTLTIAGIIRFVDENTLIVLQNENAFTLFHINKNDKRKIAYPPAMTERLSLVEVYEQTLLLHRCSVGKWLISNDLSKGLDAFDMTSGELIQKFQKAPGNSALIPFAAKSSDSKFLAVCDEDGRVSLYLTENGIHITTLKAEIYGQFLFAAFINDDKKLFTIIEHDGSYFSVIYELSDFYTNTEYHSSSWHLKKYFGFGNLKKQNPIVQTMAGLFYLEANGKPTRIDVDSIASYAFSEDTISRDDKKVIRKTVDEQPYEISNRLSLTVSEKKSKARHPFIHDTTDFEPWDRTGRPHRSECLDKSRCLFLIVGEDTIQIWEDRTNALYFWAAHDFISGQSKTSDKHDKFSRFEKFDKSDKTAKIEYHKCRRNGDHLIIDVKTDDKPEETTISLYDVFNEDMRLRQSVVSLVNSLAFIKWIQHQQTSRNSKRIRDLEHYTCQAIHDVIANQPDVWQLMDSKYKIMKILLRAHCDKIIAEILKPESRLHRPQFYGDGHYYYESDLTVASGMSRDCLRKLLDYYSQNTLALDTVGWMSTFSRALPLLYSKHRDIIDEFFARSAVFGAMTVDANKFDYCNIGLSPERLKTVRHYGLKSLNTFASLARGSHKPVPDENKQARFGTLCLAPLPEFDAYGSSTEWKVRFSRPVFLRKVAERLSQFSTPSFLLWIPAVNVLYMLFMSRSTKCTHSPFLNLFKLLPSNSLFESPCMEAVVDFKWRKYGQNKFTQYLIYYCVCFIMFSVLVWKWLNDERSQLMKFYAVIMVFSYVFFLLFALKKLKVNPRSTYAWVELLTIIAAVGANILMFLDAIGVLKNGSQPIIIYSAFAILSLWVQFILMLRVVKGIGHYVSTPISILKHTYRFLIVMALFIIGFGHTISNNSSATGDSTFNNIANSVVAVFFWTSGTSPLAQENFLALTVILIMGSLILVTMMQNILIALMTAVVELVKEDEKNMILVLRAEYLIVVEEMLLSAKEHNNREWFPKHIYYYSNTDLVKKWQKKVIVKTSVEDRMFKLENKIQEIHEKLAAILDALKTNP
ncbi:7015_t:CDS:2 [Paraglomus brasilianum]|uniref:7015_t:CDS:1 n=1 Tax=Paraglomus brasilianum TaxID=144538 RepID=A0A9N8ZCS6_9GLOM|nr:7015_t:CDS:2 [Paraglomus brasilianum]